MRIAQAQANDPVGSDDAPPEYRVRLWTPPPTERSAWFVDEWDVDNAEQVTDVIEWAKSEAAGNPFEVFLRWYGHHTSRDGECVPYARYTLVYGKPADEETVTEKIVFDSK
ncbi:hypothetical protein ACX80W_14030 [Arthrobacter sp. TMN-37]